MSKKTFTSRLTSWYKRGYVSLVSCISSDKDLLAPIRKVLKENQIEYHNVNNSAGHSIFIHKEDSKRATRLISHLQTAWYQTKTECFKCKGEGAYRDETCDLCNGLGWIWSNR